MSELEGLQNTARQIERTTDDQSSNELREKLHEELHSMVTHHHPDDKAYWQGLKADLAADQGAQGNHHLPDLNIQLDKNGNLLGIEVKNEFSGKRLTAEIPRNEQQFEEQSRDFNAFQERDRHERQKIEQRNPGGDSPDTYSQRNKPLDSSKVEGDLAHVVNEYEKTHTVINDKLWAERWGLTGTNKVGQFLINEEGNPGVERLRTGHELELYHKIEDYTRTHDISDPNKKISPDMIMKWSLECNEGPKGTCIQDAFLTAHNVMRALARSNESNEQGLPANDPVRQILEENKAEQARHGQSTNEQLHGLYGIMQQKYGYQGHGGSAYDERELFDKDNPSSPFKPLANDAYGSAGSSYHLWVGALGASSLGSIATTGAVGLEGGAIKKVFLQGASKTGQDEMPWGECGIRAFQLMN